MFDWNYTKERTKVHKMITPTPRAPSGENIFVLSLVLSPKYRNLKTIPKQSMRNIDQFLRNISLTLHQLAHFKKNYFLQTTTKFSTNKGVAHGRVPNQLKYQSPRGGNLC